MKRLLYCCWYLGVFSSAYAEMNHGEMGHDHSAMPHTQMPESMRRDAPQNANPPDNTRNPHAYADGYALGAMAAHPDAMLASLIVDRLESVSNHNATGLRYDLQAWAGKTYDKVLVRAEGEVHNGKSENARNELLWAHAISAFWDGQVGLRHDSGNGRNRNWLAVGIQGFAPYWVYVEATGYVNEQGRTALRLELEYDALITQRLILQPRLELNGYGMRDAAHGIGEGISDLELGLRLRYEIYRELAPYIGIEWASRFDKTAAYQKAAGEPTADLRLLAGIRVWF